MATFHIKVSKAAIVNGERENCRRCPIALSARLSLPPGSTITVFRNEMRVRLPHHSSVAICPLPIEAREFIRCFDASLTVVPFAFDLEIPDEVLP